MSTKHQLIIDGSTQEVSLQLWCISPSEENSAVRFSESQPKRKRVGGKISRELEQSFIGFSAVTEISTKPIPFFPKKEE